MAITYAQSTTDFRRAAGNRNLGLAETFATDTIVRLGLKGDVPSGSIAPAAARVQSVSGSDFVAVLNDQGYAVASQDPDQLDRRWFLGRSDVLEGRAWVGKVQQRDGTNSVQAHVPVLDPDGRGILGYVVIGREFPGLGGRLVASVPDLLVYLGVASGIGLSGSLLLARRIKRQTFGLEPRDIAGMVEHREALLHGIKEGVLGLDLDHHITLVNTEARNLLGLPDSVEGRRVDELELTADLTRALTTEHPRPDRVIDTGAHIIVLNRLPVFTRGRVIGSVATVRDRTELWGLREELDVTRHTADALRAQTHEFSNRLHTISGLLRLGHPERAQKYVTQIQEGHDQFLHAVTLRIQDATLAALVVAKGSVASERGVEMRISEATRLGSLNLDVAADMETIIGNFVDNALEACSGLSEAWVELAASCDGGVIRIEVRDSGPGVDPKIVDSVFERGVTTKGVDGADHGIGLALAESVCRRRGGAVSVHNDNGAVFIAKIPIPQGPQGSLPSQGRGGDVEQVTVRRTHPEGDS